MTFIIVALIVALFVAVVLATMRSGPRVTTIEHRRDETDKKDDGK
jgi:hypothetical protein